MPKTNAPRPIPNAKHNAMQTPLASDENVNSSTPENTSDNPWFKEILAYRQAGADEEALAVLLTTELTPANSHVVRQDRQGIFGTAVPARPSTYCASESKSYNRIYVLCRPGE
jgi:hypothetical protein